MFAGTKAASLGDFERGNHRWEHCSPMWGGAASLGDMRKIRRRQTKKGDCHCVLEQAG